MGTAAVGPNYLSVKLKNREEVAEWTMAFRFERPPGWIFKAGQSIDITLVDSPEADSEKNTRAFSSASAPQGDTLMVAGRMRDTAFKRTRTNCFGGIGSTEFRRALQLSILNPLMQQPPKRRAPMDFLRCLVHGTVLQKDRRRLPYKRP